MPPFLLKAVRKVRGRSRNDRPESLQKPDWEFQSTWNEGLDSSRDAGWNVASVAQTQEERWPGFLSLLQGPGPLGVSHESPVSEGRESVWSHNLIISYGYVLSLISRSKSRIAMLDWGGGIGHYLPISHALVPDLQIEYFCQEVSALCVVGRRNLPEATFFGKPNACFSRTYDFVMAGSSLWYARDWKKVARQLAESSSDWLYITRMIFNDTALSYVAVQRPWRYGYDTEYQCWILNRNEFLRELTDCDMDLVREFVFGAAPKIAGAPESGFFRGYLFRRRRGNADQPGETAN